MNANHKYREPFKIKSFINPRTGSTSWRVDGFTRARTRIRENFTSLKQAECRRMELTAQWLKKETEEIVRATKLTEDQLRIAEKVFLRLDDADHLEPAVNFWLKHGRPVAEKESPRLDEAIEAFLKAMEESGRRVDTKRNLKIRVSLFANSIGNPPIDAITAELIERFLKSRRVSDQTRRNDKFALSAFFQFCVKRPQGWLLYNPVREVEINPPERTPVTILSVEQCRRLLSTAEEFKDGRLLPYVVLGLFAGLRPYEIQRISWNQVNLVDREITIEASMTKTKRPRVILFGDGPQSQKPFNQALKSWLAVCRDKPFYPSGAQNDLASLKRILGFGRPTPEHPDRVPWVVDNLRHTSISHFFRLTGSYGLAAEMFGNSEAIIRSNYQGKVTSEDTAKFYALLPSQKGAK